MVEHHISSIAVGVFGVLLVFHGAIHLLGFVEGLGLADIETLTIPVSRTSGAIWLGAALLLFAAAGFYALDISYWWAVAASAGTISQILVVFHWGDAWAATLPNFVILFVCAVGFGNWQFDRTVRADLEKLRSGKTETDSSVDSKAPHDLPEPVRRWLEYTRVTERDQPAEVWLRQTGRMRNEPAGRWMDVDAKQYVRLDRPRFLWAASVRAAPLVHLAGRDKLIDGNGDMRIELLSLVRVVDAGGPKIDQGSMVRYLAEMVWYPSVALEDFVTWKAVDDDSAEAKLHGDNQSVEALFEFDDKGRVVRIEADRYYDRPEGATLERWLVEIPADSYRAFGGVRVPARASVSWMLEEKFTWFELEIENLVRRD